MWTQVDMCACWITDPLDAARHVRLTDLIPRVHHLGIEALVRSRLPVLSRRGGRSHSQPGLKHPAWATANELDGTAVKLGDFLSDGQP